VSAADSNREFIVRRVPVRRIGKGEPTHPIIVELLVELLLNGRLLVRFSCLPDKLEDLTLGFLVSEGLVTGADGVSEINVSDDRAAIRVKAEVDPFRLVAFRQRLAMSSGCGGGASCVEEDLPECASKATFRPEDVSERMKELQHASEVFRETGGVHCSAATDGKELFAFAEDLGRHNAVDKTIGLCVSAGRDLSELAVLTTGRLSADILSKAIRVGLPMLVSRGAATSRAVELAEPARVTTVGFARGPNMNIYTAAWRLGLD